MTEERPKGNLKYLHLLIGDMLACVAIKAYQRALVWKGRHGTITDLLNDLLCEFSLLQVSMLQDFVQANVQPCFWVIWNPHMTTINENDLVKVWTVTTIHLPQCLIRNVQVERARIRTTSPPHACVNAQCCVAEMAGGQSACPKRAYSHSSKRLSGRRLLHKWRRARPLFLTRTRGRFTASLFKWLVC